jgi:hypothetical protein
VNVAVKLLSFAALILCSQPALANAQKSREKPKHIPRTIWNFEGGVFLETDGGVSENTCFRLAGRMMAKDFFDDLKRVDDDDGTVFLRGKEPVTEFPDHVRLFFVIRDHPCPSQLYDITGRVYLTHEMMSKLRLSLFWKRGVELRPVKDFKVTFFDVKPILPYATELSAELPERLEWSYGLDIGSADVPLTDGLVLIFRREDGRIAARVAARL